jgi:predicted regulator of Ras-like GTPase activity (Roadblock/LC7/MglB family)
MLMVKTEKKENRFQGGLQYIGEYRGVRAAVIFDTEGLIIDHWEKDGLDIEIFSPLMLSMLSNINAVLKKLGEQPANIAVVKNKDSWLTVHRVGELIMAVIAEIETDDLLRVRINQAAEMIKDHMQEKYPLLFR